MTFTITDLEEEKNIKHRPANYLATLKITTLD